MATISANVSVTQSFSDINLNFIPHPVTGDVTRKLDEESVKQSIKNLLLMKPFEKKFHPEISSGVTELLFENATNLTKNALQREIKQLIDNFEPRVRLLSVDVNFDGMDENAVNVTIYFEIISINNVVTMTLTLYRTR